MALRDVIYCIQLILEARVVAWSVKISVKEKKKEKKTVLSYSVRVSKTFAAKDIF